MQKYKELIKNMGVLTLSNFGSKILSFLLVPLYTAVLSTEEYGNFDFITITVSLLIPILTLNISEGALRFLLDEDKNKKTICSICLKILIKSTLVFLILVIFNNYFGIIKILKEHYIYFILYYIVSMFYQLLQNVTRGYDKLKNIAISGFINSVLMIALNILFLLVFKLGFDGYFIANIIANVVTSLYLVISVKFFKDIKILKKDKKLEKEMISYSKPLMLSSISWWINNVSDRYIVTYMCGVGANGIYSIAYKIPSILSIIQIIFNQAWTISAVKNINDDDNRIFFKNVYTVYNLIMLFSCSGLIIFTKILAKILYMNEFYLAWKYMPFLMISVVFGALSGLLGGIFSAVKDSKVMGRTTLLGAVINIVFNIILVYYIGVIGAAISTAISYFIVWAIRVRTLKKHLNINLNLNKDIYAYILLVFQTLFILYISNNIVLYSIEFVLFLVLFILYKDEIKWFIEKLKEKKFKRK